MFQDKTLPIFIDANEFDFEKFSIEATYINKKETRVIFRNSKFKQSTEDGEYLKISYDDYLILMREFFKLI